MVHSDLFKIAFNCAEKPGYLTAIAYSSMQERFYVLDDIFQLLKELKLDKGVIFNKANHILTFPNHSNIYLLNLKGKPSDPHFLHLHGIRIHDYYIINESEISDLGIAVLKNRIKPYKE